MASVSRVLRRTSGPEDSVEAEMAARAAAKAKEKAEKQKENISVEPEQPTIEWGKGGVHTAFAEEFEVKASSPLPPPRMSPNKDAAPKAATKASPKPPFQFEIESESRHIHQSKQASAATIAKALGQTGTPNPYPVRSTEPLEHSVELLGEALRIERKRATNAEEKNARLEAELEKLRKQMMDQTATFAKAMDSMVNNVTKAVDAMQNSA